MNPDAGKLWRGPPWTLAVLLSMLGMLGPFSIDTYIPAFAGIASSLGASPVEMQLTLSAYLFGFAFMSLFHGALSDSVGRRPVVLWGVAAFTLASAGCALSQDINQLVFFRALQGLTTGSGIVVARAVVRDMFAPAQAQRIMSQITIYFGVAPAIAPMIGGVLFSALGWHSVFWFLFLVGSLLWLANFRFLPESLHPSQRQSLKLSNLLQGYYRLGRDPRFVLLALASGVPFNGLFLYVLSAPVFLGHHLGLEPTQYFWFFISTISGIMCGAWVSGRMAGRLPPKQQIRFGFLVMSGAATINLLANLSFIPHVMWALLPISMFGFGWAMMVPVVTLLLLDLHPDRRGMASSLQACVGSTVNAIVAGVLAPMLMYSTLALALGSLMLLAVGLVTWVAVRRLWPDIGCSMGHATTVV